MPQENTDYTRTESSFGNAFAPFLYMQADQPPTGSGGVAPTAPSTTDDPDATTTTPTEPSTTDETVDDGTAPADQPPTGSGG